MSVVVLRCPHCGTTQATPGECEACHESEVRYYCPNHAPGRWLDGPACAECGAAVGREPTVRPAPPRRTPAAPPLGIPRRPARPARPRHPLEEIFGGRREPRDRDLTPRDVGRVDEEDVDAPIGWRIESPPRIRINPLPVFGCIGGLMRLVMFVLIMLAMATCWFMGGGGLMIGARPTVASPGQHAAIARAPAPSDHQALVGP